MTRATRECPVGRRVEHHQLGLQVIPFTSRHLPFSNPYTPPVDLTIAPMAPVGAFTGRPCYCEKKIAITAEHSAPSDLIVPPPACLR